MAYSFPSDVQQLIESHLATGRYSTQDDVLRDALRALTEEEQDLDAVREPIDEWRAGDRGTPLNEAIGQIRNHRSDEPAA